MIYFIGNQLTLPTYEGPVRLRNFYLDANEISSLGSIACVQQRELIRVSKISSPLVREFKAHQTEKFTPGMLHRPDELVNDARLAATFLQNMLHLEDLEPGFIHR